MLDYLNAAVALGTHIQKSREELRQKRLNSIRTEVIPGKTVVNDDGFSFMANFGEMIPYHCCDRRDDTYLRTTVQSVWRMRSEESVYACRALMARLIAKATKDDVRIEHITFPEEEEIIEDSIKQSDLLAFGAEHHRLISKAEYDHLFPDGDSPLTHGLYVEITLYGEVFTKTKEMSLHSYLSVGNWLLDPKSGLLHRNDHYCTMNGLIP